MKRKLRSILAIIGITGLLLVPMVASAKTLTDDKGSTVRVNANQTVDDDLYAAGQDVVIEGTVNGDVYAAGSSVTIKGTVNGDVFAAGQDVFIGGKVNGSVRAAGQNVRLSSASIGGGVSGFAQNFTVENDVTIGRGLNFGAANANIRAAVPMSVVGGGGHVTLSSSVGRQADIAASTLVLEGAKISGDLNYYGNDLKKQNGATVSGSTNQRHHEQNDNKKSAARFLLLGTIWSILSLFVVAAVVLWLMPRSATKVSKNLIERPWHSLGWGLVIAIVTIPLVVLLAVTIIGIPLAAIIGVLYLIELYLAQVFVAISLGSAITRYTGWDQNRYADTFIGVILLTLVELIPFLGGLVTLVAVLGGLGAIGMYKREQFESRAA